MKSASEILKASIQKDMAEMVEQVSGAAVKQATADQVERSLLKFLLQLGAKLLTLFFVVRSQACERSSYSGQDGQTYGYQGERKRNYGSIFGVVPLVRPYFYKAEVGGIAPLDAALSLGEASQSDLVREVSELLSVSHVYHESSETLAHLFGLSLSTRSIAAHMGEDASDVEAYYQQKIAPEAQSEAALLVIQADGKGVPMIQPPPAETKVRLSKGEKRGRKQEAIVTTVYTIAPAVRTPQAVVDSLFATNPSAAPASSQRSTPQHKHLWATLDGKDTALERLTSHVQARQGDHIQQRLALCDGCEALQTRLAHYFPDFTRILDFFHANEYLWDTATALFGETNPERLSWMQTHTLQLLASHTETLIAELRQRTLDSVTTPAQRRQLEKTANYFTRNLPFMDYAAYLDKGWPIASGVIEGACRHFVKDRCELSGMSWSQPGVEALLRLRAVAENHDWHDYHAFRKRQRHQRLYGSTPEPSQPLEFLSLDFAQGCSFSLN